MNLQDKTLYLFGLIFALHVIWLLMLHNMFLQLKQKHSEKYAELGKPALMDGNYKAFKNIAKFLFYAEYKSLNDSSLVKLAKSIRFIFFLDLILIFYFVYSLTKLPLKKIY